MVVFEDTELSRRQLLFPVIGLDRFRRAALAVRYRQQNIIFVRKALHIRPRNQQCVCIVKLAGKDMRFSMKMMFAPYIELALPCGAKAPMDLVLCALRFVENSWIKRYRNGGVTCCDSSSCFRKLNSNKEYSLLGGGGCVWQPCWSKISDIWSHAMMMTEYSKMQMCSSVTELLSISEMSFL